MKIDHQKYSFSGRLSGGILVISTSDAIAKWIFEMQIEIDREEIQKRHKTLQKHHYGQTVKRALIRKSDAVNSKWFSFSFTKGVKICKSEIF